MLSSETNEPNSIRIHTEYQLGDLDKSKKNYLKNELMPIALATIQNFIKVQFKI